MSVILPVVIIALFVVGGCVGLCCICCLISIIFPEKKYDAMKATKELIAFGIEMKSYEVKT